LPVEQFEGLIGELALGMPQEVLEELPHSLRSRQVEPAALGEGFFVGGPRNPLAGIAGGLPLLGGGVFRCFLGH
jgi:hypothetical protein